MNPQIGDIVLVTETSGFVLPAIILRIWANSAISCAGFSLGSKETLRYELLPYAKRVKQLEGSTYWNFRPSQKETESPAQFNISTEGQPYLYWDINLQKVEIKPRQYFEDKPALGTFEWALVALKNGHKVRRLKWPDKTLAVKCEYNFLRFTDDDVFPDDSNDLLATDWVLA